MKRVKKQAVISGAILLLGCTSTIDEDGQMDEEGYEQESSEENLSDLMDKPSAIEFLPQENDLAEGFSVGNDRFLEETANIVAETSEYELAPPGEAALFYTGITMEAEDTDELRAIFILTNLMDDTLKNIELTFSFGADEEDLLIDQATVILDEAFGILSPYTARPIYVEIDANEQQILEEIPSGENAYVAIEVFDYDIVD